MNKHTPGPWTPFFHDHGIGVSTQRSDVALIWDKFAAPLDSLRSREEDKANAYLIAAAPDLLVALIKFDSVMRKASDYPDTSSEISDLVKAVEGARKAIAKATGENNA
jgi:hypothetical protein